MSRIILRIAFVLTLLAGAISFTGTSWADSARDAKASGAVGERLDGYLGYVTDKVPASVVSIVEDVNAKRRIAYQKIASQTGQDLSKVEAVAGSKLIAGAGKGEWVMNAAGAWVQR
ncbi:MAG: hypothetical protein CMM50_11200 [Rhodospirillaceae bacterium]|nr:hypothetical protein [Rhodospirillaceae bacterium]